MGGVLASVALFQLLGPVGHLGSTIPHIAPVKAMLFEIVLTFFLMWVITAVATDHRAEGQMAGLAIGGTVALAALMGGPVSGASMNPVRSLAPALIDGELGHVWIYCVGPVIWAYLGHSVIKSVVLSPQKNSTRRNLGKPKVEVKAA